MILKTQMHYVALRSNKYILLYGLQPTPDTLYNVLLRIKYGSVIILWFGNNWEKGFASIHSNFYFTITETNYVIQKFQSQRIHYLSLRKIGECLVIPCLCQRVVPFRFLSLAGFRWSLCICGFLCAKTCPTLQLQLCLYYHKINMHVLSHFHSYVYFDHTCANFHSQIFF